MVAANLRWLFPAKFRGRLIHIYLPIHPAVRFSSYPAAPFCPCCTGVGVVSAFCLFDFNTLSKHQYSTADSAFARKVRLALFLGWLSFF